MNRHPVLTAATAVVLIAVAFLSGYYLPRDDDFFALRKNFRIFGALYEEVVSEYVDDVDSERLMRTGIDAMLQRLDPYTAFLDEADHAELDILSRGRYFGIGLTMGVRDGRLIVIAPIEGASGYRQGVRAGDVVTHIGDQSTEGLSLNDARTLLRGEPGSTVDLTIQREGVDEPLHFTLMREQVQVKDVTFAGFVDDDTTRGIGYIKLERFARNASEEVQTALEELKRTGRLRALILDLRQNPGGLLDGAVEISQLFLPEGSPVVTTSGKAAGTERTFKTQRAPLLEDDPLVILIDEGSASASEIVAGATQDLDRGVIVGAPSFGKGLVQTIRRLPYNTAVKITTARYYTPSGRSIQNIDYSAHNGEAIARPDSLRRVFHTSAGRPVRDGRGIEPDVVVEDAPRSELEEALDRRAAFFLYASHFAGQHASISSDFQVTDAILQDFRGWLDRQDFTYRTSAERLVASLDEEAGAAGYERTSSAVDALEAAVLSDKEADFERHRDRLKKRLRAEILTRYLSDADRVRAGFRDDEQLAEAVRVLEDDAAYRRVLAQR